jgi:hypothetical protein
MDGEKMRVYSTVLMVVCLLGLNAQAIAAENGNPYAEAYKPLEMRAKILPPANPEPKLYKGTDNKEADYQRMLEQGYDLLGTSNFEAGELPTDLLTTHAKSVGAELVLVTTRRSGDVPASIKIEQMRKKAKEQNTDTIDPAAIDQSSVRYTYDASYWVKLAPPIIGLHVRPPGKDEKVQGLVVIAVIKNSPADKALLQELDVIQSIGDELLQTPEALSKAAQRYAGKNVDVIFMRQGNVNKASMTLNPAY